MSDQGTRDAAEESIPDIPARIRTGLSAGFNTSLKIIKVSVPRMPVARRRASQ